MQVGSGTIEASFHDHKGAALAADALLYLGVPSSQLHLKFGSERQIVAVQREVHPTVWQRIQSVFTSTAGLSHPNDDAAVLLVDMGAGGEQIRTLLEHYGATIH